jgi:high frequency lysogenization protein
MSVDNSKLYKSTLALAGIAQAATLVTELAQSGRLDDAAFQSSIYSIFQTDPPTIDAVYGNPQGVRMGLEKLVQLLAGTPAPMASRYILALMRLQRKIFRSKKITNTLSQRVEQAKKQVDYFHLTHPTVITNLADIYLSTISILKFRIIIWGNQRILSASENVEKVRALLLAGIRSAVLWKQMGGSRLQIIFQRNKIKNMAQKILTDIETHST